MATSSPTPTSTSGSRSADRRRTGSSCRRRNCERLRAQVLRNLIDEIAADPGGDAAGDHGRGPRGRADISSASRNFNRRRRRPSSPICASIGSSERSLKRQIRGELAWQRLQRRQIEPFVTVGEDEVRTVIERSQRRRGTAGVSRRRNLHLRAAGDRAAGAGQRRHSSSSRSGGGASFQAYARQFSEASTAAVGGDLGWVRAEQLPAGARRPGRRRCRSAASAIRSPVPGGFSIVALADTRQVLTADPRDAVLSLMQIVDRSCRPAPPRPRPRPAARRCTQRDPDAWAAAAAREAAARRIGAELISNDQVRVRDLPPALQQMLLNLSVGQATPPFGSPERVSVLVLCGRDDPPEQAMPTPGRDL